MDFIRCVQIDKSHLFRRGLRRTLERHHCKVVGQAAEPDAGIECVRTENPDLVLTDISFEQHGGLDLVRRIASLDESPRILVVSRHDERLYGARAIRAGANGYVMKDADPDEIREAVRTVMADRIYLSDSLTERLYDQITAGGRGRMQKSVAESLSDRELEIFERIGQGCSSSEIADELEISPKTVQTYRARIKDKLGCETGSELTRLAVTWVAD